MVHSPERQRRFVMAAVVALGVIAVVVASQVQEQFLADTEPPINYPEITQSENVELATEALAELEIKGRAPKTGYDRNEFGAGWATIDGCDMRNIMLAQAMPDEELADDGCLVLSGTINDPYTGKEIDFRRGQGTSDDVQIDHVVALSDAWQKGAQGMDEARRAQFANDPLNLLAVDGPANQQKGDSDAASWLPPSKSYRCRYVARQIAVKAEYELWVTQAEYDAMERVLATCPTQPLPIQILE